MPRTKTRIVITATCGVLFGSLGAGLHSPSVDACSCLELVEVHRLELVSADSNNTDEAMRWDRLGQLYWYGGSPVLDVGEDQYRLEGTP